MSGIGNLERGRLSFVSTTHQHENHRKAEIETKLSQFPAGFASAVVGLLDSRDKKNAGREKMYELQIIQMCRHHGKTIEEIEKLLGFSLNTEQTQSK